MPHAAPIPDTAYALYDGRTGAPLGLDDLARRARAADVVAFGELHGHPAGARLQAELFDALAGGPGPVALALEFFEADTQAELDRYLAGEFDEETLATRGRQGPDFARTHAPLLRRAREAGFPVLAANAPRRLVTAWRKAQEEDYETWLAGLPEEDRPLLARSTVLPEGRYAERFREVMGPMADAFLRSQALWDDTMAERVATLREERPDARVMLVVGGFHVQEGLGTVERLRARRPADRVLVVVMSPASQAQAASRGRSDGREPGLRWEEGDRDQGDVIVKVAPPRPHGAPRPDPHVHP